MKTEEKEQLVRAVAGLSLEMVPQESGAKAVLRRLDDVRVVVFDVYGTLFISGSGDVGVAKECSDASALAESLADAGFQGCLAKAGERGVGLMSEVIEEHHGVVRLETETDSPEVDIVRVWADVCERLIGEELLDEPPALHSLLPALAVRYECRVNPVWPMPGAKSVLNTLRNRFRLGLVSNAQFYTPLLFEALLERSVESLGFEPELCMWSYETGRSKPDTAMFKPLVKALAADGIKPYEIVYVGNDMLNDVYTAHESGLRTVLFAGDRRSLRLRRKESRCRGLEPDAVITELYQLPEILGAL
jgi:putative hydrolase of the HAD superfamily